MKFTTAFVKDFNKKVKAGYPFDKVFPSNEVTEYSIQHPISKSGVVYFIIKDNRGNLYSYPNIEGQKQLPKEIEQKVAPLYNEYTSSKIHLSNKVI